QRPLPTVKSLTLSFTLPGQPGPITAAAELVWKDIRGNLGVEFLNTNPTPVPSLSKWIKAQSAPK
ncbi:MAG TPA: hypothetical protein VEO19_02645, partial [Terriglobia bacterium]|nr:hypothetical protein [Terriglobia bacterium]